MCTKSHVSLVHWPSHLLKGDNRPRGGGYSHIYGLCRYVPPDRVRFLGPRPNRRKLITKSQKSKHRVILDFQDNHHTVKLFTGAKNYRYSGGSRHLKGATSSFVYFEKRWLNFSKSSFPILFNLLHPQPSLFLFALESSLWYFSSLANHYF